MRDFKGMKRQRSRNRSGGGGGKPQHNANRAFESNGPDGVKIRGAAQHVYEKYQQLARDALTSGDRILAESYQQHAEHYFRVLRAMQPQRPASDIIGRDAFASGFDIDFEDDGGETDTAEAAETDGDQRSEGRGEWRGEGRRDDRQRDDRPRDDRQRDDRPRDRNFSRDDRQRDDRQRDERPREDRPRDDRQREDRYRDRDERPRDDRPPREDRPRFRDRDDRPPREDRPTGERRFERVDPLAIVEPQASPLAPPSEPAAPSPMLRSEDGGVSHAPAFLQPRAEPKPAEAKAVAAAPAEDTEARPARAPRRRRAPRNFEAASDAPAAPASDATEDA